MLETGDRRGSGRPGTQGNRQVSIDSLVQVAVCPWRPSRPSTRPDSALVYLKLAPNVRNPPLPDVCFSDLFALKEILNSDPKRFDGVLLEDCFRPGSVVWQDSVFLSTAPIDYLGGKNSYHFTISKEMFLWRQNTQHGLYDLIISSSLIQYIISF